MKVEFNGGGFKAEMNSSFDEAFGPRVNINLTRFYNGSVIFSILAFAIALVSLSTTIVGQFGVDLLTQLLTVEAQQLAVWFAVISLCAAAVSCFLAVWAITLHSTVKKAETLEESAFYTACTFLSIFSFVIVALCVILNIVFLIT